MGAANSELPFCNVDTDFPEHRRCMTLKDNDTRWLYMVLWCLAVRRRTPVIDHKKFDDDYLCLYAHLERDELDEALRDIYRKRLIGFTEAGGIVVFNVILKHPRVQLWQGEEPEEDDLINPWEVYPSWHYGKNIAPAKKPGAAAPVVDSADYPDPLETYGELAQFYARLRGFIQEVHPKAKLPDMGSAQEYADAQALDQLVRLDGHTERNVVRCLTWLFTSSDDQALWWRDKVQSIQWLRKKQSGDYKRKYDKIEDAWRQSFNANEPKREKVGEEKRFEHRGHTATYRPSILEDGTAVVSGYAIMKGKDAWTFQCPHMAEPEAVKTIKEQIDGRIELKKRRPQKAEGEPSSASEIVSAIMENHPPTT